MDNFIQFAAIRGTQAHRAFYVAMMPYSCIEKVLGTANGKQQPLGRPINKARLPAIAEYVSDMSEAHCIPPIHVMVEGLMRFDSTEPHRSVGTLRLEANVRLHVIDGQHRVSGIVKALAERPSLTRETLPVCFYAALDLVAAREMFETINRRAIRPATLSSEKPNRARTSVMK